MAQLTDDCFAFSGPLLPIADMERLIAERVTPVTETETVPLIAARGRVLAGDVSSPLDLPPFDNSAVDGYAVRHADLNDGAETRLAVTGRLTAGSASSRPVGAREAVRIFTGAPMPEGADTVFMQEDVRPDGSEVIVPVGLKRGANRRLAGEDVRSGAVVLPAGRRLGAQDVALAAAVGLTALDVRRRVRVALFSTGDEIVEPGRPRPAAALYDANRYLLAGMLDRASAVVVEMETSASSVVAGMELKTGVLEPPSEGTQAETRSTMASSGSLDRTRSVLIARTYQPISSGST
jgi:molybdopterin molybdotransferase